MSPFRSVGGKLALGLLAVVAGVLAIVYAIVVPLYSSSLRNAELGTLQSDLRAGLRGFPAGSELRNQWAVQMAEQHDVRAVVFTYIPIPPSVTPYADSNQTTDDTDLTNDPVALRAAGGNGQARGVASHNGREYAEVATPLPDGGSVAMFLAPHETQL